MRELKPERKVLKFLLKPASDAVGRIYSFNFRDSESKPQPAPVSARAVIRHVLS